MVSLVASGVPGRKRNPLPARGPTAETMTAPVRRCPDHGYFEADAPTPSCPDCGARGTEVLDGGRRTRLSKFVSGALRHFPDDAGLSLDAAGWTDRDELAAAVERKYGWADARHLDAVVATDPKGRFETRGDRVRAAYGHSVDVDLDGGSAGDADAAADGAASADIDADTDADAESETIPDTLYHGTDPANLDAILSEGLKPMGRQEVHLSESVADAREVGRRHASNPAVLAVDAAAMRDDGRRVNKRGEATYTADAVPPKYLAVREA